ncbi:hypothetical protein RAA17_13525 [Komagataeibacter rhaeticus]|nr:hypothetical protein [Komagataeibacter rhaeticus]
MAQARAPDCAALARQALPDTTFTTVETVAAGSWQPRRTSFPASCPPPA